MSKTVARNSVDTAVQAGTSGGSLCARDGGRKYLNTTERGRALQAIAGLQPEKALFALTLAWAGARVSEILALTPASFQLDAGIVAFQTLKRRRHSVREVPIPADLVAELGRCFGISSSQQYAELALRPLWPWCRVTGLREIKGVMKQSGIFGHPACPRGFRHSFGVGSLQTGVRLTLSSVGWDTRVDVVKRPIGKQKTFGNPTASRYR